MDSERELQLLKENQSLKKRIKDMEELFDSQDNEFQEKIKGLTSEKNDLVSKNDTLESKLFVANEEKAELAEIVENLTKSAATLVPKQLSPVRTGAMSESLMNDFASLQDTVDGLTDEKEKLESKVRDLEEQIQKLVDYIDSLENKCAEQDEVVSSVNHANSQLLKENKEYKQQINGLQMQLDMLSVPEIPRGNGGTSLFHEVEAERAKILEEKIKLEQEVAVLKRSLTSHGPSNRRESKDLECLRETMKTLSEKNKKLQKEVDRCMDFAAENAAIKQSMKLLESENESLRKENGRLKKQFINAESRADENAYRLSKGASKNDVSDVKKPILSTRELKTTSTRKVEMNVSIDDLNISRNLERTSSLRARSSSIASSRDSLVEQPLRRKRGIMLDFTEPIVARKKMNMKLADLSDSNKPRQIEHLKSHYDPDTGTYDQTYGESPARAAKLQTPKKDGTFRSILRSPFRR